MAGCGSAEKPQAKESAPQSSVPGSQSIAPHYGVQDLAGQWNASLSFAPQIKDAVKKKILAQVGGMKLLLNKDGSFKMSSPADTYTGGWQPKQQVLNEEVILDLKTRNGLTIDQWKQKLARQGKPADVASLEKAGVLELSADGKELVPQGRSAQVLVTFKKQPG